MPPPNGSDSERLMAQIEAYLRTGEGPPPAPEPQPSESGDSGSEPGGSGQGGGEIERPPRPGLGSRLLQPLQPVTGPVSRTRLWKRLAATGRTGPRWPGELMHPSGGHPSERVPGGPPKWTVMRVVLVVGFLVALLLVPVLWKKSTSGGNPDGSDHASAAPAGPGYSFLLVNRSGTPVRWNPCDPIYYQLDLTSAPSWAETDIGDAISSISTATGIQFVFEGSTNQFPDKQVPAGWTPADPPPVVIAWASAAQSQNLNLPTSFSPDSSGASPSSGVTSSTSPSSSSSSSSSSSPSSSGVSSAGVDSLGRTVPVVADDQVTGHEVYVAGSVVISSAASGLADGFGPGGAGVLLLHQLGRLVGLGDTQDPLEVMNPDVLSTQVNGLGPGDRAGLKRLGSESGCLKTPANPAIEPVL